MVLEAPIPSGEISNINISLIVKESIEERVPQGSTNEEVASAWKMSDMFAQLDQHRMLDAKFENGSRDA